MYVFIMYNYSLQKKNCDIKSYLKKNQHIVYIVCSLSIKLTVIFHGLFLAGEYV